MKLSSRFNKIPPPRSLLGAGKHIGASSDQIEQRALTVAIQIAAALDAAHRRGIVHRDLKPAGFLMIRRMLLGVKQRAEALAAGAHPGAAGSHRSAAA